jgi:NAD(P)-dependent dehydrogenase (short-subunit alcohol dehydrogenase family)
MSSDSINRSADGAPRTEGRFVGKRALVTGATSGIGRAVARALAAEGAAVLAVCRRPRQDEADPGIQDFVGDVTDAAAMAEAVAVAAGDEELNICVANAGIFAERPFLEEQPEVWARVVDVNLIGCLVTFQAAAKRMVADGTPGRLIATTSTSGIRGESNMAAYSSSKSGVCRAIESLALDLGRHGITVNAIAPGETDTEMHRAVIRDMSLAGPNGELDVLLHEGVAIDRLAHVDEVAAAFAFLASDDAGYVTGVTIPVDGGILAGRAPR